MAEVQQDPSAIIRSKNYTALLVIAAVIGVPVAAMAYFFLFVVQKIQEWVYVTLPAEFSSQALRTWWPALVLTVAGLIVGLAVSKLPGKGGEVPIEGLKAGGGPPVRSYLLGIAITAIASIGLGAVLGPEAPLIALGGGVAYLLVALAKKNIPKQAGALTAASGSFAAISTLLGSPLTGAFLLMEATALGGLMMEVVLLPGILAAGIGYLVFVGLDAMTGLGTFSLAVPDVPGYGNPTITQFIVAIVIGCIAPLIVLVIRRFGMSLYPVIKRRTVLMTTIAGGCVGLLAVAFTLLTDQSASYVLFSGQDQLSTLFGNATVLSIGTLLLIFLIKGIAYGISLVSFRGGPTFPAMFLGAVLGVLLFQMFDVPIVAGAAIGIGAMTAAMLRLPLTAVLLTTLFLGANGLKAIPLTIVAVVISYVASMRLMKKTALAKA